MSDLVERLNRMKGGSLGRGDFDRGRDAGIQACIDVLVADTLAAEEPGMVSTTVKRTPGKWLQSSTVLICAQDGRIIANCAPMDAIPELAIPIRAVEKNAAFIVQACNKHDALVGLVREMSGVVDRRYYNGMINRASALLVGEEAV